MNTLSLKYTVSKPSWCRTSYNFKHSYIIDFGGFNTSPIANEFGVKLPHVILYPFSVWKVYCGGMRDEGLALMEGVGSEDQGFP